MFAIVPITNTALGTLPPERVKNASGLFNLTRNLGGAIGLAAINTLLNDRIDLHLARLHESVNWAREPGDRDVVAARRTVSRVPTQNDGAQADDGHGAPASAVMSFADVFLMLTVLFVVLAVFGIIMRRPEPIAAGADGH